RDRLCAPVMTGGAPNRGEVRKPRWVGGRRFFFRFRHRAQAEMPLDPGQSGFEVTEDPLNGPIAGTHESTFRVAAWCVSCLRLDNRLTPERTTAIVPPDGWPRAYCR